MALCATLANTALRTSGGWMEGKGGEGRGGREKEGIPGGKNNTATTSYQTDIHALQAMVLVMTVNQTRQCGEDSNIIRSTQLVRHTITM